MSPDRAPALKAHRAFSLIELLVVVSMIVLLIAMLLPVFGKGRDTARSGVCMSNLHQIHMLLRGQKGITLHSGLPDADTWLGVVVGRGGGGVTVCPLDEKLYQAGPSGIDELSVVQWEHNGHPDNGYVTSTPMKDIVAGNSLPDPQVSWWRNNAKHIGGQLKGEDEFRSAIGIGAWSQLPSGTTAVSVDWSGRFTIDSNNGTITVYHKWQGDPNGGGSRHFIYNSQGEVTEIGGGKHSYTNNTPHQGFNPAFTFPIDGVAVSYGMNSQIKSKHNSPNQIMIMDYEKTLAEVDSNGYAIDDLDVEFAPRHQGRANVKFVDGHVEFMTQAEIELDAKRWLPD